MSHLGDCHGSFPSRGSPRQRQRSPVRFVPNRLTDQSLGHGIVVRYPCKYKHRTHIAGMEAFLVSQEDQASLPTHYDCLGLGQHETLITDIYGIRVSSDRGMRAFEFNAEDCNDITVCLTLKESNPIYGHQKCTAHIKVDGDWTKTSASYKNGTVSFNVFQLDTVCVSCTPFKEEFVVSPSGGCFKSSHNPAVEILFPENSVNNTEKIEIQILPADLSKINDGHDSSDDAPTMLTLSDCVEVSHSNNFTLLAPVRLGLPLKVAPGAWTDQYDLVDLHWTGDGEINVGSTEGCCDIKTTSTGYYVTFDVREFTARQLVVVNKKASPKFIKTSAKVAVGIQNICKILVFTTASNTKTRTLRFECVQLKRIKDVVVSCEEFGLVELKQCRSTEFMIADGERIRVDVDGCGRVQREIPREHTFIPFLGAMSDNHISIPIDVVEAFGKSIFVVLNFTRISNSNSKVQVHNAHFDPQTVVRKLRRRRSRSPYRQAENNGKHSFGNTWKTEVKRNGQDNYEGQGSYDNPDRASQRPVTQECPHIAIREPTVIEPFELMSAGSVSITIAETTTSGTPRTTTPDSSRPTTPGTQVTITQGMSRQNSLEVLLGTFPSDDSFTIGRATPKFNNAVFGAKSLHRLAKKVPPKNTTGLAIHLDLDHTSLDHLLHQYRDNSVTVNFKVIMEWLGHETGSAEKAIETLSNAMEEIGHNDLKTDLLLAFKENRPI